MMITIHGLPITAKYHDLKILIKQQCNISDFILDSLVSEVDGTKKVRVGLADDSEGSRLLKCLDGFRFGGNILRLVPVGKGSSTTQQPNSFDTRGTYQQSTNYSNQNLNDRNKSLDAARQTNWAHNQWSTSQPQLPVQNSYGYQQPAATPYGQPTNTVIKPHFEPRDVTPTGRGPPQSQNYGYNPKSNLISLGPQNNMPSTLREIPQATSRAASGRYSNQNYDIPTEKPITIMKENFQGPNQYNLTSSHNQSSHIPQGQISPWATQQAQQKTSFEKPLQMFDKKPYDDRKYPSQAKYMQDASKPDESYKYDKGGQSYSPQRKDFRDIARDEERGRVLKGPQYSDRRTPERRMSPSNRNMPSSGRHFSSGRQMSPSGRHASPPGRHIPSTGRHTSPPNRHEQQSGRHSSPARHSFQSGRHTSPGRHGPQSGRMPSPGRQMLPAGRVSPQSGRHVSGGRYGSPPGRQVLTGRHISPTGRHVPSTDQHGSLSGRRMSPSESHMQMKGRQMSPNRQMPTERKVSPSRKMYPPRRDSPQLRKEEYVRERIISPPSRSPMDRRPLRQSPERDGGRTRHDSPRRQSRFSSPSRMEQKQVQYQDDHRNPGIKDIRPAYEPVQAPNEAMYSGGYRPNVREEAIKYQSRSEHWKDRENFSSKAIIDDRRESSRMQKFDIPRVSDRPRSDEQEVNRSRSPKRDRSPLRDRFKRHSPSPRSPRRSWALEKRRSPEIREPPPPPVWPQEKEEYQPQQVRPKFSENEMEKNSPVWETREKVRDTFQSSDDRRNFSDQRRPDVGKWKPIPGSSPQPSSSSRFDEPKPIRKEFVTRQEFIRDNVNLKVHPDTHEKEYRQDRSDMRYKSDFDTKHEIPRKRDEFSGRIEEKKKQILEKQEQLQKEIDQAYKRAVDFTKKAEMYIKGELKKESNYDDNRRRSRSEDRANPKEMQRFKRDPYEEDRDREKFRKDYRKPQYNRDDDRKNVHEDLNKPRNVYDPSLKHRMLPKAIRVKRMNVADDISDMIMSKHGKFLSGEMKKRVLDELKCTVTRKLHDMFDFDDVSEADMTAKFRTKYSSKDIEDIFKDVMFSLPNHYRTMKRQAQDDSDVPAKSFRRSSEASSSKDTQSKVKNEQNWDIGLMERNLRINAAVSAMSMINSLIKSTPTNYQQYVTPGVYKEEPELSRENQKDSVLYLCKDDFQPILEYETTLLKEFLIEKMIQVSNSSRGWAPEFTLNKQNSDCRHEVLAGDEKSKNWLMGLDFSQFKHFNVLVYNTEELWYERAAIWLPGHSRTKTYGPLQKLKLQNKHLEGVNIGKWKAVKSIVTLKGTRLYVDMPPSSARALDKYNKMLSYELQKVNVFLKAVAVDKDAFDAGLNETSLTEIPPGTAAAMMPSIGQHPDLIKMALKGNKPFTLPTAKKLKDIILYKLFKYHDLGGQGRTDFIKYGFCQGGFFGIIPENEESKRWLCALDMGHIQQRRVIMLGADGVKTKYFKMLIMMPRDYNITAALACERIRHGNQGVKGLNFNLWKNPTIENDLKQKKTVLKIDMDLESVETLFKLHFQLDYVAKGVNCGILTVIPGHSIAKLKELIAKHKEETNDSYDVANMELATTDSEDDVVCLN